MLFWPAYHLKLYRVFLDHSSHHHAAFVFGDDDLVGAGIPHRLGVTLLARPGDDPQLRVHRLGGHRDVEVVRIVVDHDADAACPRDPRRLQCVVALGVSMDDEDALFQQLVIKPLVCFDEDEGDIQAIELIHDGPAHLTVSANNEMIPYLFEVRVVDHQFPRLPSLFSENGDENALRDPDLEGEHSQVDHQGEELRGIPHFVVMDRMRMEDPEQGILPADAFEARVDQNAKNDEDGKKQDGQPQPPEEYDQDSAR